MRRAIGCLLVVAILGGAGWFAVDYVRRHPENVPWTRLDLDHPIGLFTARKLAALGSDGDRCIALLDTARTGDDPAPPRQGDGRCGYSDGVTLGDDGRRSIGFEPRGLVTSCPVAAATYLLERDVIQPAARRHFGTAVARIAHLGSYSCRRVAGRTDARLSEHSTADAIDIAAFVLADGRRISVAADWGSPGSKGAFLKDVRDGACRTFSTVLTPDYNEAHADHFHFDQAERGAGGAGLCR